MFSVQHRQCHGQAAPLLPPDGGPDLENRILRTLSDIGKRLDERSAKCSNLVQLFAGVELVGLRIKLREATLKSLQASFACALKAMELTWRKCFYEPINQAKHFKMGVMPLAPWSSEEVTLLRGHLTTGLGFYHHFLMQLQAQHSKDVAAIATPLDFGYASAIGATQGPDAVAATTRQHGGAEQKQALRRLIHRCLMSLGDLSRYQLDLMLEPWERAGEQQMSQRYYHQAVAVDFQYGLPYNQLATLAWNQGSGLHTTFYYLKSMSVECPFEGADLNLRRFLEKKSSFWKKLPHNLSLFNEGEVSLIFLQLMYVALFDTNTKKLANLCKRALRSLIGFLDRMEPGVCEASKEVWVMMVLILILAMEKLKEKELSVSLLKAYLLAMFTHFVGKITLDLHFTLFGPEAAMKLFEEPATTSEEKDICENKILEPWPNSVASTEEDSTKATKDKKRSLQARFRRKPNGEHHSDREDVEDGDNDSDDSSDQDHDESSDISEESLSQTDSSSSSLRRAYLSSNEDSSGSGAKASTAKGGSGPPVAGKKIDSMEMISCVRRHQLISALKLCGHWLKSDRNLVEQAGGSAELLWRRLCQLSLAIDIGHPRFEHSSEVTLSLSKCKDLMLQAVPWPEDYQTRGMKTFSARHCSLNWKRAFQWTETDLGLLLVLQFDELFSWLADIPATNMIRGTEEHGYKALTLSENWLPNSQSSQKEAADRLDKDGEGRKEQMMHNMAHLWLQQEVRELEDVEISCKRRGSGGMACYSPYLVIDHLALIRHLHAFKDIVASRKYAVIIPTTVVQELDRLKKNVNGARSAIRWLEKQFEEGNRWLRCQKPNEKKIINTVTYPKKKDRDMCHYFRVLECCLHFASLRHQDSSIQMVTLVTSLQEPPDQPNDVLNCKPPLAVAETLNIKVMDIQLFIEQAKVTSRMTQKSGYLRTKQPRNVAQQLQSSSKFKSYQSKETKDNG